MAASEYSVRFVPISSFFLDIFGTAVVNCKFLVLLSFAEVAAVGAN